MSVGGWARSGEGHITAGKYLCSNLVMPSHSILRYCTEEPLVSHLPFETCSPQCFYGSSVRIPFRSENSYIVLLSSSILLSILCPLLEAPKSEAVSPTYLYASIPCLCCCLDLFSVFQSWEANKGFDPAESFYELEPVCRHAQHAQRSTSWRLMMRATQPQQ